MIIGSGITIGNGVTITSDALYYFNTFNFLSGNVVGPTAANSTQIFGNTYSNVGNTWLTNTNYYNYSNGYQYWTVPANGTYQITAAGSRSGIGIWSANATTTTMSANMYGRGATISGSFFLQQGQIVTIAVGQPSANISSASYIGMGGGGGTFVILANTTPLVVAGGGGGNGGYSGNYYFAGNGNTSPTGGFSAGGAPGGINGLGGNSHINSAGTQSVNGYDGGAGGGFSGNGASGALNANRPGVVTTLSGQGGWSFGANLVGGSLATQYPANGTSGGFGGGGGGTPIAGGGGGGYSGGGGGYNIANPQADSGGGGGSWVANTAVAIGTHTGTYNNSSTFNGLSVSTVGTPNSGSGYVTITRIS
jgi:hypothetical protein